MSSSLCWYIGHTQQRHIPRAFHCVITIIGNTLDSGTQPHYSGLGICCCTKTRRASLPDRGEHRLTGRILVKQQMYQYIIVFFLPYELLRNDSNNVILPNQHYVCLFWGINFYLCDALDNLFFKSQFQLPIYIVIIYFQPQQIHIKEYPCMILEDHILGFKIFEKFKIHTILESAAWRNLQRIIEWYSHMPLNIGPHKRAIHARNQIT